MGLSGHNDSMCIETISNRQEGSSEELKLTPIAVLHNMQGVNHFS